jgi:hypothetical protein
MVSWQALHKVSPALASDRGPFVPIRHVTASNSAAKIVHPIGPLAAVLDGWRRRWPMVARSRGRCVIPSTLYSLG